MFVISSDIIFRSYFVFRFVAFVCVVSFFVALYSLRVTLSFVSFFFIIRFSSVSFFVCSILRRFRLSVTVMRFCL